MVHTLIIYAHPKTPGHCPTILKHVEKKLKEEKRKYAVLDLYKMKFDPVLHEEEHYTAGEGHRVVSKENLKIQKLITDSQKLIIIYPTWWNGTPAILKGFFDKILTSHFAFKYKGMIPVKLLKGRECAVFTTHGAPPWAYSLILGGRSGRVAAVDTLGFCGIKSKVFHYGPARRVDEKVTEKLGVLVGSGLSWLYRNV